LGIVGIISPIAVQSSTVWKEIPISFLAIIVLYGLSNPFMGTEPVLSRFDGLILLILFISFLYYVYSQLKSDPIQGEAVIWQMSTKKIWLLIAIGLGGLVLGGRMVVVNAVDIATQLGVSEKIIGLTIVAAGTSLPELTTSVVAAFRRNSDIAIGNVIGSNIFNIFFILPISSLIQPIVFNSAFNTDMYILMIGTAFLFLAMFTGKLKKLDRWEAGLLLLTYLAYTAYLISVEAS
jgi:cation:H+ antiporter